MTTVVSVHLDNPLTRWFDITAFAKAKYNHVRTVENKSISHNVVHLDLVLTDNNQRTTTYELQPRTKFGNGFEILDEVTFPLTITREIERDFGIHLDTEKKVKEKLKEVISHAIFLLGIPNRTLSGLGRL
ncbi:hypothetical protein [Alicyclobacillus acidoterrestris]|uniref:Uncharacterized protein n=1 Tax=Alicyclobacillus acidoterrestris (strain ATCC 49025 / DSM 3922 / CIP 106132 / NCIMB 13137 / GD3B) TaxID=1356854 RepID=T0BTF5_ALIAG|nr:hypothetical protein [Alicyclobacillus acidoterrestris]EPZ47363.1 hypothetical protein N007_06440 [Alicyclobacillus acidoterrestris ATCC 49025]UNO49062.1 hypothetical protein K1I37_00385 [Alicyclobacillus acidoterrestris]